MLPDFKYKFIFNGYLMDTTAANNNSPKYYNSIH